MKKKGRIFDRETERRLRRTSAALQREIESLDAEQITELQSRLGIELPVRGCRGAPRARPEEIKRRR